MGNEFGYFNDAIDSILSGKKKVRLKFQGRHVEDMSLGGVDGKDHPDYVDAYIESAVWSNNGTKLNDEELEQLTDENGEWINQNALESLITE